MEIPHYYILYLYLTFLPAKEKVSKRKQSIISYQTGRWRSSRPTCFQFQNSLDLIRSNGLTAYPFLRFSFGYFSLQRKVTPHPRIPASPRPYPNITLSTSSREPNTKSGLSARAAASTSSGCVSPESTSTAVTPNFLPRAISV